MVEGRRDAPTCPTRVHPQCTRENTNTILKCNVLKKKKKKKFWQGCGERETLDAGRNANGYSLYPASIEASIEIYQKATVLTKWLSGQRVVAVYR